MMNKIANEQATELFRVLTEATMKKIARKGRVWSEIKSKITGKPSITDKQISNIRGGVNRAYKKNAKDLYKLKKTKSGKEYIDVNVAHDRHSDATINLKNSRLGRLRDRLKKDQRSRQFTHEKDPGGPMGSGYGE